MASISANCESSKMSDCQAMSFAANPWGWRGARTGARTGASHPIVESFEDAIVGKKICSVEPKKLADPIAVAGDPLQDIGELRRVKGGRVAPIDFGRCIERAVKRKFSIT
jgi:hypothetical protein